MNPPRIAIDSHKHIAHRNYDQGLDPIVLAAIAEWESLVVCPDVPLSHIRHALRRAGLAHDVDRTRARVQRLVDAGVLDWSPDQSRDRKGDVRRLGAVAK